MSEWAIGVLALGALLLAGAVALNRLEFLRAFGRRLRGRGDPPA